MERLTIEELIEHCDRQINRLPSGNKFYQEHESVRAYLQMLRHYIATGLMPERVAELAKAERDGRLVVLPVNPYLKPTQQNEMYICENGEVWAIYVTGGEAGPNSDGVFTVEYMTLDGDVFSADDIGKTVFLTRQEAEEALGKKADE